MVTGEGDSSKLPGRVQMTTEKCIECGNPGALIPSYDRDSTTSPIFGYLCRDCWEEQDLDWEDGDEMELQGG